MRKILLILGTYLGLAAAGGVFVSEGSLHLRHLPLRHSAEIAAIAHEKYGAELQDVAIRAHDGVELKAWYIEPKSYNGRSVILLHGITDNREGVAGYGRIFLDQGYSILLPDARAHGESGGQLATYGIREADDVHQWITWLYAHHVASGQCVYGFGES
jgi:uncharacterized protein